MSAHISFQIHSFSAVHPFSESGSAHITLSFGVQASYTARANSTGLMGRAQERGSVRA